MRYSIVGAAAGLLLSIAAVAAQVILSQAPLTLASLVELQLTEPALWVIESTIVVLILAGHLIDRQLAAMANLRSEEIGRLQVDLAQEVQSHAENQLNLEETDSRIDLFVSILRRVVSEETIDDIARATVLELSSHFPGYRVSYAELDPDHNQLYIKYSNQPDHYTDLKGMTIDLDALPAYVGTLKAGATMVVSDVANDNRFSTHLEQMHRRGIDALINVPLLHGVGQVGILALDSNSPREWLEHEVETLDQVGHYLEIAMKDYHQREQLRQAIDELELAKEGAEAANRAKSVFLANMSHELRTPLNAMLGMAEVLADSELSNTQQEYTATIRRTGATLLRVIDDLLNLSQIENDHINLHLEAFNLHEAMQGVVELFRAPASQKGLSLKLIIEDDVPKFVEGDAIRLQQVISNLIGGAIKFTSQGGVLAKIRRGGMAEDKVRIYFSIKDSGVGVPKEEHAVVYDSLRKASKSSTRTSGSGVGLSIAQRLVELMGGELLFESIPGAGATYSFILPMRPATTAPEPAKQPSTVSTMPRSRILLVEDDQDNRKLVRAFLKDQPVEIEEAHNGQEAIDKYARGHYDIVLMDMNMPIKDGYQATKEIVSLQKNGFLRDNTPIVALTALALREERERALQAGCSAYLSKPIGRAQLLNTLAEQLELAHAANQKSANQKSQIS